MSAACCCHLGQVGGAVHRAATTKRHGPPAGCQTALVRLMLRTMDDFRPRISEPLWDRVTMAALVVSQDTRCYARLLLARWAKDVKERKERREPVPELKPAPGEDGGRQRRVPITRETALAIRHAAIDASASCNEVVGPSRMLVRILHAVTPSLEDSIKLIQNKERPRG